MHWAEWDVTRPLQEGLMAVAAKQAGDNVARMTLELDESTDMDRLELAW